MSFHYVYILLFRMNEIDVKCICCYNARLTFRKMPIIRRLQTFSLEGVPYFILIFDLYVSDDHEDRINFFVILILINYD